MSTTHERMYLTETEMHADLVDRMRSPDPALGEAARPEVNYMLRTDLLRGCWRERVSEALVAQAQADTIRLWPGKAPGAVGDAPTDMPLLYPVLPDPDVATGAAMIVCPGGGFKTHVPWEAFPVAEWFHERGIAAFVLRYRLLPYVMPALLEDGRRAVRTVRARAAEYGLDPGRIGMIGFSAGGYVAAAVSTMHDAGDPASEDPVERCSARPDLAALFYPLTNATTGGLIGLLVRNDPEPNPIRARRYSPCHQVSDDTPPTYLYGLLTDQLVAPLHLWDYARACHVHDVPLELHFYGYGRHGSGVAYADERLDWRTSLAGWLGAQGYLTRGGG